MPGVDRNLLRIGVYEILWAEDVPDPVAISEAVELARELSTDESPKFINGLLSKVVEVKPQALAEAERASAEEPVADGAAGPDAAGDREDG